MLLADRSSCTSKTKQALHFKECCKLWNYKSVIFAVDLLMGLFVMIIFIVFGVVIRKKRTEIELIPVSHQKN